MEHLGVPLDGFSWNLIFEIFENLSRKLRLIKIWQEWRVLYVKMYVRFWYCLAEFFLEWEMFQTKIVEKIRTHVLCSVTFFVKLCRLWDNVEKYGRAIPDQTGPEAYPASSTVGTGALSWGWSRRDVALIRHPHPAPKVRMSRAFMACYGATFTCNVCMLHTVGLLPEI
jgi:hypothetical protein